ncbi:MAG: S1C family serine protease [Planctomycetota bacterium]
MPIPRILSQIILFLLVASTSDLSWSQPTTDEPARIDLATVQQSAVKVLCADDQSSGVIVSDNGIILTVAHGIDRRRPQVHVRTADGQQFEAKVLRLNETADLAVLQVSDETRSRFLPVDMVPNAVIRKGDWVLAFGFPGRAADLKHPIARIGRVMAVEQDRIRSSCVLTTGDSGGPLLNSRGQLIGLHRQIGAGMESNHHSTLAAAVRELSQIGFVPPRLIGAGNAPEVLPSAKMTVSEAVSRELTLRTVRIMSLSDAAPMVLGTAIDSHLVVTKLSELTGTDDLSCLVDGRQIAATVRSGDLAMDLAVLELSEPVPGISLPLIHDTSSAEGTVIFSLNSLHQCSAGIIARTDHTESPVTGRMGARLSAEPSAPHVAIEDILPNGAAAVAGFRPMDQIVTIDGRAVETLKDLAVALRPFQPGDRIPFELQQPAEQARTVILRLQHDVSEKFEKTEFLDGRSGAVSERRTGFRGVVQHDLPLQPRECGGPVCNSSGLIIGINIARRSRESTLMLPMTRVLQFVSSSGNPERTP